MSITNITTNKNHAKAVSDIGITKPSWEKKKNQRKKGYYEQSKSITYISREQNIEIKSRRHD
jgi:hypothetical protein